MSDGQLRYWIAQYGEDILLADGFDEAVIGVAERCGQPPLAVYDAEKCIAILVERDGMDYDEAYEFFHHNTLGAWVGEMTPLYMWRRPEQIDPQNDPEFTDPEE